MKDAADAEKLVKKAEKDLKKVEKMAGEKGSEKLYTQAEFDAAVAAAAKDSARIAIKTVDIKRAELKED